MSILGLIASRNFIAVNKTLIKAFGLEEAIILGELASEYQYWVERGEIDSEGYFYSTVENVENNTTIKEKRQRAALNNLIEAGVIEMKLKGIPAKRHIKIKAEQLTPILLGMDGGTDGTSSAKMAELDAPDGRTNKNKANNNKNNNKNNNTTQKKSATALASDDAVDLESEFENLWKLYPRKEGKSSAQKDYIKARKDKKAPVTFDEVKRGIERYIRYITAQKTERRFIKQGSTWFHQRCWEDEYLTEGRGSSHGEDAGNIPENRVGNYI